MFDELYQQQSKTAFKAYLLVIVVLILIIVPIKETIQYLKYQSYFSQVMCAIQEESVTEIPLNNILSLFEKTTYRGNWTESLKPNYFLKEKEEVYRLIELKTIKNSDTFNESYTIKIYIYDEYFLDTGRYEVTIDSNSLLTKQRMLDRGKIIYETDRPLIGFYEKIKDSTQLFHPVQSNSFIISKLKLLIRIIQSQETDKPQRIDVLLSLSSSQSLKAYSKHYHEIFLSLLLILQCCLQIKGIYHFYNQIYRRRQCGSRYSILALLIITTSDGIQIIFLINICLSSQTMFAIFSIPTFLLILQFFFMEMKVLKLIDHQYNDHYFLFLLKIYGTIFIFYSFTFVFNLNGWLFTLYSCSILFPQIFRNYIVGHKMKIDLNRFLMFALPRYGLTLYLRAYKYNIFNLQPNYLITFMNLSLIIAQLLLLLAQKKYGVRAILPKFMHPSQFKYFMNEPHKEDLDCSICLISLKLKPMLSETQIQNEQSNHRLKEDIYNNVVLTPCRHRFHIQCLLKWMETKLQCPNCRTLLPPLQDYQ